ncbi:hypothetical protein DPX16_13944 [Anabarilius grahami]|uniref:Uncharacterized protein n=1 Tax=Anabarilius grahami TaxID=495550 RepID=A0A3N0Y8R3_ANAGA|nr:hypothetical protein DPX16_13944 [Anabarilius grahami]
MASLALRILIGNSSQAGQSDPSSATSAWARPRHSTQSSCASGKLTGPPHMQQRDILVDTCYFARMQEGIAICVIQSSRADQQQNQAPGEGERFWGVLASDITYLVAEPANQANAQMSVAIAKQKCDSIRLQHFIGKGFIHM